MTNFPVGNRGLGLFDSGPLAPGTSFQATYVGAGTYAVEDTLGGHTSKVQVPMRLSPPTAPVGTTFSVHLPQKQQL